MNKLLITGSGGFIGQTLLPIIQNLEIVRFSGDLRDEGNVTHFINDDIVAVINLAARLDGDEAELRSINIEGTANLVNALKRNAHNLKTFIQIGSAAEYGFSDLPINENAPTKPAGVYGETKLEQTNLVLNGFDNLDVTVCILRLFNVTGKSMSDKMLFSRIKAQFDDEKSSEIVISNKKSVRDWIDVNDVCDLIIRFLNQKVSGKQIYNIGRGIAVTNEEVVKKFEDFTGKSKKIIEKSTNIDQSVADISKLNKLFPDWKWKYDLTGMIRNMYE